MEALSRLVRKIFEMRIEPLESMFGEIIFPRVGRPDIFQNLEKSLCSRAHAFFSELFSCEFFLEIFLCRGGGSSSKDYTGGP